MQTIFSVNVPVRWGDLDAQNHLSNVVYFRLFEEARVQLLMRLQEADPAGPQFYFLANTSCDYLKPVHYPATVRIDHVLNRVGRTSLDFSLDMRCADNTDILYARGRYVLVGADAETERPMPWTDPQRAFLHAMFNLSDSN